MSIFGGRNDQDWGWGVAFILLLAYYLFPNKRTPATFIVRWSILIGIISLLLGGCFMTGKLIYKKGRDSAIPMKMVISTNQVISTNFVPYSLENP